MTPWPVNGWHWREWVSEAVGTALLMFAVVTAWTICVEAGQPWASPALRVPILSVVAGGAVVAIAYSPFGKRSGAHLNPAVTLGLFLQRAASSADLAGYVMAQMVGGTTGFAAGSVWGPWVADAGIQFAQIAPDPALPQAVAAALELVATAVQLVVIFLLLRSTRFAPLTGVVAGVMLGGAIASLATVSGAGFNPVRGLSPDFLASSYPGAWVYLTGPLLGAVVAAAFAAVGPSVKAGKLHHDPSKPCYLRCELPHGETARV